MLGRGLAVGEEANGKMIEVTEEELQPLSQFPLKWRWTDPKYGQLPPELLATITPLSASKARTVWEIFRPLAHNDSLAPELFEPIVEFNAVSNSPEDTKAWLQRLGLGRKTPVIVSWNPEWAVLAPFGVFCDHWDDFCYPSSDDVIVCPCSEDWAILYRHEEVYSFGRRRGL